MPSVKSAGYHVFGVCCPQDFSLLVDYLVDDPAACEARLLQCIHGSCDPGLLNWPARDQVSAEDVFEIECVFSVTDAQEAVAFWRAYFRALGETVIDSAHLRDRLTD
ncbi:TPA: hypothetical protein QDC03_007238 [Burkholderia cepacia]|nr:hypothetical protein [Burkholderia cepacia]HDR9511995.1 hypothetical protein [Burkholderia cepacia]